MQSPTSLNQTRPQHESYACDLCPVLMLRSLQEELRLSHHHLQCVWKHVSHWACASEYPPLLLNVHPPSQINVPASLGSGSHDSGNDSTWSPICHKYASLCESTTGGESDLTRQGETHFSFSNNTRSRILRPRATEATTVPSLSRGTVPSLQAPPVILNWSFQLTSDSTHMFTEKCDLIFPRHKEQIHGVGGNLTTFFSLPID